jgi:hypothetical protein
MGETHRRFLYPYSGKASKAVSRTFRDQQATKNAVEYSTALSCMFCQSKNAVAGCPRRGLPPHRDTRLAAAAFAAAGADVIGKQTRLKVCLQNSSVCMAFIIRQMSKIVINRAKKYSCAPVDLSKIGRLIAHNLDHKRQASNVKSSQFSQYLLRRPARL